MIISIKKKQYLAQTYLPKGVLSFVVFFLFIPRIFAQTNAFFDSFPQPAQLIQRDESNIAIVSISGKVFTGTQTDVSLIVYKNKKVFFYRKQKLLFAAINQQANAAPFSFTPIINAELSEYDFKCYAFVERDSVLIKDANEVVCGDNIIIYGQSNALAEPVDEIIKFKDEFKFGRSALSNFEKNEFSWVISRQWNHFSVGLIGLEIQRQLIDKYKIPIGIINGSVGNKGIDELSLRDEANHDNISTIYGRLLKRTKALGLDKNVRLIVWRQGESEALEPSYNNNYDKKFDKFRKQLYEDYPALKKIYTFQNNIYFGNNTSAGNLRDFQRTIKSKYTDCEVMSTFGTPTFDGLHYKYEGYLQNGVQVSRQIARDFYDSKDTEVIDAPNIQSAYFTTKKDSLILVFDKNQKIIFPKDEPKKAANHPSSNVKDYIYLDGKVADIIGVTYTENHVILKLKNPTIAQKISYSPDYYTSDFLLVLPGINQIVNSRGVRALTFKDVVIATPKIQIRGEWDSISNKRVVLNWDLPKFLNLNYVIEKSQFSPNNFYEFASTGAATFIDNKVKKGVNYYYRIRIKDASGVVSYSNTIKISTSPDANTGISNIDNDDLLVYPNPVTNGVALTLTPLFELPIRIIHITDTRGVRVEIAQNSKPEILIQTHNLSAGVYIIEAILEDNTKIIKRFVVQ